MTAARLVELIMEHSIDENSECMIDVHECLFIVNTKNNTRIDVNEDEVFHFDKEGIRLWPEEEEHEF